MSKHLPLADRVLIDRHQNPHRTSTEIAEAFGALRNSVSTALWIHRKNKMIDEENRITDAGRAAVERLTAANDSAAVQRIDEFAPSPRATKKKAAKAKKPARRALSKPSALLPGAASVPVPQSTNRAEAAHRVAESVIANARTSQRVLRAYLDESVEVSPLLESLLAQCDGALTLIEQAYHVAAR